MRGIFGLVSLVAALAVVAVVAVKQLKATNPAAAVLDPAAAADESPAAASPRDHPQQAQQRIKDDVIRAFEQGAARAEGGDQ